jgi:hypothetical protein
VFRKIHSVRIFLLKFWMHPSCTQFMVHATCCLVFPDCITWLQFHAQIPCLLTCNILSFYFTFSSVLSKCFLLVVAVVHFPCVFTLVSIVLLNSRFSFPHYCSRCVVTSYDTSLLGIIPLERLSACPLSKPVHCRRTRLWQPCFLDYGCCHTHTDLISVTIFLSVNAQGHL